MNFKLKSHTEKKLIEHLKNVGIYSKKIIYTKQLKLFISTKDLSNISYLIGVSHDFGKANSKFQDKLRNKTSGDKYSYHSLISSILTYLLVKDYCKKNKLPIIFAYISCFIVRKHHGDLDYIEDCLNIDKKKLEHKILEYQIENIKSKNEIYTIYQLLLKNSKIDFRKTLIDLERIIKDGRDFEEEILDCLENMNNRLELFLITELLFSVLVDCDKKDAANFVIQNSIKKIPEKCVQEYLEKKAKENPTKFNPLLETNRIKNKIFDNCVNNPKLLKKQNIYSITAPTGAGKTLTSLATALKLKSLLENEKDYKIHYVLPFTTIIDQNYEVFKEVLQNQFDEKNENDYIMKHHYLTTKKIKKQNKENKDYSFKSYMDELLFIKSWDSALVVSSYVQLLETIIGGKNSFMNKFHNIVNSVIILDEVQCISSRYWNIFRELFSELANKFDVYFIFLTATQPLIFNRFENKKECVELANPNKVFENKFLDRVDVYIDPKEKTIDKFVEEIKDIEDVKNRYLFILNTKKSSLELYNKSKKINNFKNHEKIYLSTNLTPFDRKKKLSRILGVKKENSEEWEIKPLKKYVIVTTQLIEAGVDISSDICYRDFAPLSSLIQSAGRVNRFGELKDKMGKIHFIKLKNEKQNKLFSNYVYNNEPVLEWTENVLRDNNIKSSKDFYELSKKFFEQSIKPDGKSKLLCQKEEDAIKNLNFHHGFKFIENKPTHSIFILNDNSRNLIENYKKIYLEKEKYKDFFIWKGELKRVRKKFQNFIVEIWPKDFSKNFNWLQNDKMLGEDFFYLDVKKFPELYKPETGFNLDYENFMQV